MGMPKTRGCPCHCDTGLLPQKRKRDLNGEQLCTIVVVVVFIPTEIRGALLKLLSCNFSFIYVVTLKSSTFPLELFKTY